jgi:hypothetical protein
MIERKHLKYLAKLSYLYTHADFVAQYFVHTRLVIVYPSCLVLERLLSWDISW